MKTFFADTFYYLALLNPSDRAHGGAVAITGGLEGSIITTEWVLTELADGIAQTPDRRQFKAFLDALRADPDVRIVAFDRALFDAGVELYDSREDKDWSLTDCISFVVMQREHIVEALTGDKHFEQAGYVALLRS